MLATIWVTIIAFHWESHFDAVAEANILNASIIVVINHKFVTGLNKNILHEVHSYVNEVKTQNMKYGSLNVEFHSSSNIHLRRDVTALLSISTCDDTWKLFDSADGNHFLHLAITEQDCPRLPGELSITVPLVPMGQEIPQILLDLRSKDMLPWRSVTIIYDSSIDTDIIRRVIHVLSMDVTHKLTDMTAVMMYQIDASKSNWARREHILHLLRSIPADNGHSNYLVIVNEELIGIIMEAAASLSMVHPLNQWLYLTSGTYNMHNSSSLASLLGEGHNLAYAFNVSLNDKYCVIGLECHIKELLHYLSVAVEERIVEEMKLSLQVSEDEWEILKPSKQEQNTAIVEHIKEQLETSGKCGSCLSWQMKAAETWGMHDGGQFQVVATWNPLIGACFNDSLFPHVTHAFRGRTLPIVSFHNPPWQIISYNASGQLVEFRGLVFEILNVLAKKLNFSYSVLLPSQNGEIFTSGTSVSSTIMPPSDAADLSKLIIPWDQLINIVQQKKVFLGAGAFTVTAERKALVNFTLPFGSKCYTFMLSRPKELSRILLFMYPFTTDTWLCIALGILIMAPTLYLIHKHSPYYSYHGTQTVTGLNRLNNCFWYMYGALLQQGGMHVPTADSGRLIVGTWWLVVIVIVSTYSGNLVAFLTFPKLESPITNIDDILNHRATVSWGLLSGGALESHLKNSDDPKFQELYEGAVFHKFQDSNLAEKIRNGDHVYLEWRINLMNFMKKDYLTTNTCDFSLGDDFLEEKVGMIIAKDSPYLHMINKEIHWMYQMGLVDKWMDDYLPKKDHCSTETSISDANIHTVNLDDMQGSFFVLFLGTSMSVLLILGEYVLHRWIHSRERVLIKPFVT